MRAHDPTPILLFAKSPGTGRAKTRLAAAIGEERAARLYAAFLDDVIATASRTRGGAPELWAACEIDRAWLVDAYPRLTCHVQSGSDLGERLEHALAHAIERSGAAIALGTDVPTLPAALLEEAIEALGAADVVLGPAPDGGYWAIGARRKAPALERVRWSSAFARTDTLARLEEAGRRLHLLSEWHDVDEPHDLHVLRRQLEEAPDAAPATRAVLSSFDRE